MLLLDSILTPLVNKFYQANKVRGRANKQDQIWVVKTTEIVAACRIQYIADASFLSTLYVAEAHRNQGIAKLIVNTALSHQKKTVYTFAYRHLKNFYVKANFSEINSLPSRLDTLFRAYTKQGRNIVAMKYSSR